MDLVSVATLVVAVAAGLAANRRWRRRDKDPEQGTSVQDMLGPMLFLALLFLAFVLVSASASYNNARASANVEADATDHLFEVAAFAAEPQREQIQAALVCYSRAVTHHEWGISNGRISPVPSQWTNRIRGSFEQAAQAGDGSLGMLVAADQTRGTARRDRANESTIDTPAAVYALLLAAVAVALAGFAFSLPAVGNTKNIIALALLTMILLGSLLLIRDLQQPFTGLVKFAPTAMQHTAAELANEYTARYPTSPLPCDNTGQPS